MIKIKNRKKLPEKGLSKAAAIMIANLFVAFGVLIVIASIVIADFTNLTIPSYPTSMFFCGAVATLIGVLALDVMDLQVGKNQS